LPETKQIRVNNHIRIHSSNLRNTVQSQVLPRLISSLPPVSCCPARHRFIRSRAGQVSAPKRQAQPKPIHEKRVVVHHPMSSPPFWLGSATSLYFFHKKSLYFTYFQEVLYFAKKYSQNIDNIFVISILKR